MSDPDGVHAQVAVSPPDDCPVAALAADHDVREFVPAGEDTPAQVVVAGADPAELAANPAATPVVATGPKVVCRLRNCGDARDGDGEWCGCACGHAPCLADGDDWLPVRPYAWTWRDDSLRLWLAVEESETVEATIDALEDAGFGASLERLGGDAPGGSTDVVRVDLSVLTDRQREVARLAVQRGYHSQDGTSAAALADDLGISATTLSEHLRAVRRKLGRQLFRTADGGTA